jgi:hypothetical protein
MKISTLIISILAAILGIGAIVLLIKSPYHIKDWFIAHNHACSHPHCCAGTSTPQRVSSALARINEQPLITTGQLQDYVSQCLAVQPAAQSAWAQQDPGQKRALYQQLLQSLINDALVKRYVHDQGWDQDDQFIQQTTHAHAMLDNQLRTQLLQQHIMHDVQKTITDEQAKDFYESQRDQISFFKRDPFIEKAGGVTLQVVSNLNLSDADRLIAMAQKNDLMTAAADMKKKVVTYRNVTPRSLQIPDYIRPELNKITQIPFYARVAIPNSTTYAIIQAVEIQPSVFKPYSDPKVKASVVDFMIRNMLSSEFTRAMNQIKQDYAVTIDEQALELLVRTPSGDK